MSITKHEMHAEPLRPQGPGDDMGQGCEGCETEDAAIPAVIELQVGPIWSRQRVALCPLCLRRYHELVTFACAKAGVDVFGDRVGRRDTP